MTGSGYLEYTVDDILSAVKTKIGNADGSLTDADALPHVIAGAMAVYNNAMDTRQSPPRRHFWSFLEPEVSMTFAATVTGTASGQGVYSSPSTTLTATTSVFDDSMVGHNLTFTDSATSYVIASVTSGTVIVLTGDASAEKSGDTFSIDAKGYHSTPAGFRGIRKEPVWAYSSSGNRYRMIRESPARIRARWRSSNETGYTRYWALEPIAFVTTATQTYRFLVAPVPCETMIASLQIILRITDPAANKYLPGGDLISQAVLDAALADEEFIRSGAEGAAASKAMRSLWSAIDGDKESVTTTTDTEQAIEG